MCCTFKSISNRTITFEDEDGKEGTIIVANGAVVTLDGKTSKLTDLRDGDAIEFDGNPAIHVAAQRS
jgi:hypothetical protein